MSTGKHIAALIIIAVVTLAAVFVIQNPDLLSNIWLWIVGLIGPIIGFVQEGIRAIKGSADNNDKEPGQSENGSSPKKKNSSDNRSSQITQLEEKIALLEAKLTQQNQSPENKNMDTFTGTTLTVLRYHDDGETTLGLLFVENQFFCYTLEDTYRPEKIVEKTRIPAGIYAVDFNRHNTPLTLKYRQTRAWFTYHLELKNVPNYTGIYIHSGGNHEHTAGCLLVSNGILATDQQKILNNSRMTFESLYKLLSRKIDQGDKIRIRIEDEKWFANYINSSI